MNRLCCASVAAAIALSECASSFITTGMPTRISSPRGWPSVTSVYSTLDVSEDAHNTRDVASFQEWASYAGIQQSEGFQLVSEDIDGFLDISAITVQGVPGGSPVVFVPAEMILSSNYAIEEFGRIPEAEQKLAKDGYENEIQQFYLMLKILFELEKGQDSLWFHHFNALPRYFSNGASMTLFCYTCVPPFLEQLCKEERVRYNSLRACKRPVTFLSNDTKGNDELWMWAFQVVYTRGFETVHGDFCIAPMADMINHNAEANVELAYDELGNCYAQALYDIPANSPICMSYGDPWNPSFLLSRYGFLEESSPSTFCKLLPSHVSEEMKNLGYAHNKMLFYKDTGEVAEEVWDVLLYMLLGEADQTTQQQFYHAHMSGDYASKQSIHEKYYPMTSEKLKDHIDELVDEIDALARKVDYGSKVAAEDHPRLPLIMRHNAFVKNAFLTVKTNNGL